MDAVSTAAAQPLPTRAVGFTGHWREYLPIAITNLLLTIVTLGIYRFWAKARVRRYLWSRTRIIDDQLEWTGTGGEMFVGFLMVMGVLIGCSALILGLGLLIGQWFMMLGLFAFYIFLLWAIGFAQFRALRYRLSRTYWHGIRGGSEENGVHYGWSALGRNFLAGITVGIMTPAALTGNWNERTRAMSFGPHMLDSDVDTVGLQSRWMMLYGVYLAFFILAATLGPDATPGAPPSFGLFGFASTLLLILGIGLVMTSFWALFFRKAADTFRLGELSAAFEVSTYDWIAFYAKVVGLTIITLGFGALFWGFWRWQFVMERLELFGEIDLGTLTQSTTTAPRDAEGFADAFDIGAF